MKRLAVLLVAITLAASVALPQSRAATPDCLVTVHVANSGAYGLSNCNGARETNEQRFHADLEAMLEEDPSDSDRVIFDAEPQARLFDTMSAMNWVMDVGIEKVQIIDEPGRPPFLFGMPSNAIPATPVFRRDATQADIDREEAAQPKMPRWVFIKIRPDHRLDVTSHAGPPLSPRGRSMMRPDREDSGLLSARDVKMEDLPLLMPWADTTGMIAVHGALDTPWTDTRAVYRAAAAAGFGRLISEDPAYM